MSRRDEALCEELKEVARRLGVQIREETLLREVGYHVRSGTCRVRGEAVIFLERSLPAAERVQVLVDGLAGRDVETLYLSPALRRLLERGSGACRVRGENVIFLDRTLPPAERLQVLLDELAGRDVETLYLSPVLRRLLERRSGAAN